MLSYEYLTEVSRFETQNISFLFQAIFKEVGFKTLSHPSVGGGRNELWCIHTMEYHTAEKGRRRWYTLQLELISKTLYCLRKASPQKLHTYICIYFCLHDILKKINYGDGKHVSGCQGLWGGGSLGQIRGL